MHKVIAKLEEIFKGVIKDDNIDMFSSEEISRYFSFLDDYSVRNNLSLALVHKHTLTYHYQSPGFFRLWQTDPKDVSNKVTDVMTTVFENPGDFIKIMEVHENIFRNFSSPENILFTSTFCGVKAKTFAGKSVKLLSHNIPLKLAGEWQYKIHFCENRDVNHLFGSDHFWVRVVVNGEVFHYISTNGVLHHKEILSKSELACVQKWADGLDLSDISKEMSISINTAKNHLKAARNKLGARDTTALVELCKFCGIL